MNLNALSKTIHEANKEKGFYEEGEEKNIPEILCLIHSEISEALDAHRSDTFADSNKMKAIFCLEKSEFLSQFEIHIKDTFEDEISDALIRLFDLCGFLKIDIQSHIEAKLTYNVSRPYKHNKKY